MIGVYPTPIKPGWFNMIIWATNSLLTWRGLVLRLNTSPLIIWLIFVASLNLMPIRWPTFPYFRERQCSSIETAVTIYFELGQNSCCPGTKVPVKTFPRATKPTPETLTIYLTPNLRGFSTNLLGSSTASMVSIMVGPLYQGHFSDLKTTLSPFHANIGMNEMLCELNPMFLSFFSVIYLS